MSSVGDGEDDLFESMSDVGSTVGSSRKAASANYIPIEQIKKRVLFVIELRKKDGPPTPTAKFPVPPPGACKFCRREFCTTVNPLKKHPSPYLELSRPGAADCMCCRNAQNWGLKGVPKIEISNGCQSDPEYFQRYLLIVFLWEDRFNNPTVAVVKLVEQIPDECRVKATKEKSTMLQSTMMLGVLWPAQIFKKHFGRVPLKKEMKKVNHNGAIVQGVIKEPSFGTPIGTITLQLKSAEGARLVEEVADSVTQVLGSQALEAIFAALQGRLHVTIALGERTNEGSNAGLKMKVQAAEDDDLDLAWDHPLIPAGPSGLAKPGSQRIDNGNGTLTPPPWDDSAQRFLSKP
jgi:hypothetical protein